MDLPRISQNPSEPSFAANPLPFYRHIHALGGAVLLEEYGLPVVASPSRVNAILRDRRFGRSDPFAGSARAGAFAAFEALSLLERDGVDHARLRARVARAFTARKAEEAKPMIAGLADRLIDSFAAEGHADLASAYCRPLPLLVAVRLLGAPETQADEMARWSAEMVAPYAFLPDPDAGARADAAAAAFEAFITEEIESRRRAPRDDLLSVLAAEAEMSAAERAATAMLIFNAGHEGAAHALAGAIIRLLEAGHGPGEGAATEAAVEESLRLDPPLHLFRRFALEDVRAFGLTLERGAQVGLLLGAAGLDPAQQEAPERFDPSRPCPAHVAFGAGPHFCLGAPLARLELAIGLRRLFARLPGLRLVAPPVWANRYHFRAVARLTVEWPVRGSGR